MLAPMFALGAMIATIATARTEESSSVTPEISRGEPISLKLAKKVMAAAEAEAEKNNFVMAIVILDSSGHMVMLHKMDASHAGAIAEDKARTALESKQPSKVFEDLVASGRIEPRTLTMQGVTPLEGGLPIVSNGKIIGSIGVSGALTNQDGHVARVGANAAK